MAFTSSLTPTVVVGPPLLSGERKFHRHCGGGAVFFPKDHNPNIISSRNSLSVSSAVKCPRSDEPLLGKLEYLTQQTEELMEKAVEIIPKNFPFKINDKLGEMEISLTRKYKGETVEVLALLDLILEAKKDDGTIRFPILVTVSKSAKISLHFTIQAPNFDEITVHTLLLNHPDLRKTPGVNNTFCVLPSANKGFVEYLKRRDIDASLIKFLYQYAIDNKWLRDGYPSIKRLKKFLES